MDNDHLPNWTDIDYPRNEIAAKFTNFSKFAEVSNLFVPLTNDKRTNKANFHWNK